MRATNRRLSARPRPGHRFRIPKPLFIDLYEIKCYHTNCPLSGDPVIVGVHPHRHLLVVAVAVECIEPADLVLSPRFLHEGVQSAGLVRRPFPAGRQVVRHEVEASPYPRDHTGPGQTTEELACLAGRE